MIGSPDAGTLRRCLCLGHQPARPATRRSRAGRGPTRASCSKARWPRPPPTKKRRSSRGWAPLAGGSTLPTSCSNHESVHIGCIASAAMRSAAARVAVWLAWDCVGVPRRARRRERLAPTSAAAARTARRRRRTRLARVAEPALWRSSMKAIPTAATPMAPKRSASRAQSVRSISRCSAVPCRAWRSSSSGAVAEGMRALDEVNAAVVAGELTDLIAIGLASCYMIAACDRVRDYDRAVQWCARLKAFCAMGAASAVRGLPDAIRLDLHVARDVARGRAGADAPRRRNSRHRVRR